MTALSRLPYRLVSQPQQVVAIAATLLLHVLLIAYLLQQQFDNPPLEPKVHSIQMRFVTLPAAPKAPAPVVKPQTKPAPVQQAKVQQAIVKQAVAPQPVKPVLEVPAAKPPQAKPVTKTATPVSVSAKSDKATPAEASQSVNYQAVATPSSSNNDATDSKATLAESKVDKAGVSKAAETASKVPAPQATSETAFDVKHYQPVSKQAPDYPARAMDQGLQGDCTVSYMVNAQGRVENPQAEADCHPLFIRPAINAAKNFQYQPRVVNGQAVAVPKVRNTFQFRINGR
jgi:protein TonB